MADNYPDAPGRRMAIDQDGTRLFLVKKTGGDITELDQSVLTALNNESNARAHYLGGTYTWWYYIFQFPEPRDLVGAVASTYATTYRLRLHGLYGSYDSTNGFDGTWQTLITDMADNTLIDEKYRTAIEQFAGSAFPMIRFEVEQYADSNGSLSSFHLYGKITDGETPDRLIFLDTENGDAEFAAVLDYGSVPRAQLQFRTFKVKNISPDKTAEGVTIVAEAPSDPSDSWYTFSLDGTTYQAVLTVGDILAGAEVEVHLRQEVPADAPMGLKSARIRAKHTGFA